MDPDILNLVRKHWPPKSLYGLREEFVPGKTVIPYSGPVWTEDEVAAAIQTLLEGHWLTSGENVRQFENGFCAHVGQQFSVMTNSGSSANLLMVAALRSKRLFGLSDIEIVTPVAGFPTTVAPILQNGFRPLFVDIDLSTLNLNLDQVESQLTPKTKAIMFAHVLGNPPDMDRILDLCRRRDLIFLEDTCDALGSTWDGRPLGGFGTLSTCSFYPAHHITTGEGGMVSTSDKDIERVVRSLCWWGRDCYCVGKANLLEKGTCGKRFDRWLPDVPDLVLDHKYLFTEMGYNLKPLDLQGAIGVVQLDKLNWIHQQRTAHYEVYRAFFSQYPDLFRIAEAHPKANVSWFGFPVTVTTDRFTKHDLTSFLESAKIQTRNYFAGNLLMHPAYSHLGSWRDYPNAVTVTRSTFFLGVSPNLTAEQTAYVKSKLAEFVAAH